MEQNLNCINPGNNITLGRDSSSGDKQLVILI